MTFDRDIVTVPPAACSRNFAGDERRSRFRTASRVNPARLAALAAEAWRSSMCRRATPTGDVFLSLVEAPAEMNATCSSSGGAAGLTAAPIWRKIIPCRYCQWRVGECATVCAGRPWQRFFRKRPLRSPFRDP